MMLRLHCRSDRATVLIAVLSILAVLSLMAATFGMVMLVELGASQNQTDHEMAREAANAGYQYVLQQLKSAGSTALAGGTMPDICPDPSNRFFCQELYTQRGVKVGFVLGEYDSAHHAAAAASWPRGVGMTNSGMFDLNNMGNAADMGDRDYVGGNRYTSYEVSLVRLIKSRFDTIAAATGIDGYYTAPAFTTSDAERLRIARYIASAIVLRRYGADGLPGTRGLEEGRHDHLAEWFRETPYVVAKDPSADHDDGAPASGLFWGEVLNDVPGPGPYTIAADNTGAGWVDWPANRWDAGFDVYFATGLNAGEWVDVITTTAPNTLLLANTLANDPAAGDKFCIVPAGYAVGTDDFAPTAMPWPNDTLACEKYIQPLAIREGTVLEPPTLASQLTLDDATGVSVGDVVRIMEGPLRGQVRFVNMVAGNVVGLTPDLPSVPNVVVDAAGTVTGGGPSTLTDSARSWATNEHKGRVIEFMNDSTATTEWQVIESNTEDTITISGAWTSGDDPTAGPPPDTYRIYHLGYRVEHDFLYLSQVLSIPASNDGLQATGAGTPFYLDPPWDADQWAGCLCNIFSSADADEVGQTRLIISNTADTLTFDRTWNVTPVPANNPLFRIELPQDAKYRPDDLRGDDMVYRSVPEILPVMTGAIEHDPNYAFTTADAGVIAAMLYSAVSDDLTVSSGLKKEEGAGINDWFLDGIDNDDDGEIDNENLNLIVSADLEKLATNLYNNLGLRAWAHEDPDPSVTATRVEQAAQIVASIIDFRDDDHVPIELTYDEISEASTYDFGTVYGAEGLHITEVMTTPAAVSVTANDIDTVSAFAVGDGGTSGGDDPLLPTGDDDDDDLDPALLHPDLDGWDWDAVSGCWVVHDPTNVTGSWRFLGLRDGWYAIRIHGGSSSDMMTLTQGVASGVVVTDLDGPPTGEWWGYVRDIAGNLMAVQVTGGQLTFDLMADAGVEFYGFQLLPQYVEITNIAADDIPLGTHELDMATLDGNVTLDLPPEALIHGASGDGEFPINYGTYIVAMSEDAYERQWGVNTNGIWGDVAGEDYPVFFLGDEGTLVTDRDANADLLLLTGSSPSVELTDRSGTLVAGGAIDGNMSNPTNDAVSIEKDSPLSTVWGDYASLPSGDELMGSQNRVTTSGVYTCLNRHDGELWSGVTYSDIRHLAGATDPAFDSSGMVTANQVLPIILNRPYPSPGWLGLVPVGNISGKEWRTIDADPNTDTNDQPEQPEHLLGTLMSRALVGGVHARINLNSPSSPAVRLHSYRSVFDDTTAATLASHTEWTNWDELLRDTDLQNSVQTTGSDIWNDNVEDSGAGTFADDFEDDSDEREEWARQYSNLIDLQTSNFKYVIAGLAYDVMARDNANPIAEVRIEIELDISQAEPRVVHFRYLTE